MESKYRSLRCELTVLDQSSEEFVYIKQLLLDSQDKLVVIGLCLHTVLKKNAWLVFLLSSLSTQQPYSNKTVIVLFYLLFINPSSVSHAYFNDELSLPTV